MEKLIRELEAFVEKAEQKMELSVSEYLDKTMPGLTEEKFALYEKNGNRLIYERDYFARRRFLTLYGVAALRMRKDGLEYLGTVGRKTLCKKLEEVILDICEEECWAVPAHVKRDIDPDWRNTVDLFASETGGTIAYLIDQLQDWLSRECCQLARIQVKRRILDPFIRGPRGKWFWEKAESNWNAVCNGNILSVYLHLKQPDEELDRDLIDLICDNMISFIDSYAEDGTCLEGIHYYDYGMTYFVNAALELYEYSCGEIDLLRGTWERFQSETDDKRCKIATWWTSCFFPSGRTVSFSDGESRAKFRMGLACVLAMKFPGICLPDIGMSGSFEEDFCARFTPYRLDYFGSRCYLERLRALQGEVKAQDTVRDFEGNGEFIILDSAQWCIGKAANGVGMACKGGHNGEPHNHNDVGSFLYLVNEDMLLVDLGQGEYCKEYFNENRYNIFCNHSFSHNVPIIAGQGQKEGAGYRSAGFEAVDGERYGQVRMNLEEAYEAGLLRGLERRLLFDKISGKMEIRDTFLASGKKTMVIENLVTGVVPRILEEGVLLQGANNSCMIRAEVNGKCVSREQWKSQMQVHVGHYGDKEEIYQIQWEMQIEERTEVLIRITKMKEDM